MKCSDLFETIKAHWPEELELNESTRSDLNTIYWDLESQINHETEHWLNVSSWAFHQALDVFVKQQISSGFKTVKLSEMPLSLFNKQMLFNLEEDGWEEELEQYEQS